MKKKTWKNGKRMFIEQKKKNGEEDMEATIFKSNLKVSNVN